MGRLPAIVAALAPISLSNLGGPREHRSRDHNSTI